MLGVLTHAYCPPNTAAWVLSSLEHAPAWDVGRESLSLPAEHNRDSLRCLAQPATDVHFVKCSNGWRLNHFPAAQHGPSSSFAGRRDCSHTCIFNLVNSVRQTEDTSF